MHKPVRRELGLVLGHGQVMFNDQVGDDFALALELGRLEREMLALIQRGLDLVADRYSCRKQDLGWAFKLSREGHQLCLFGFELRVGCGGHVRMNRRACSLVRASAVRMCTVPVRGPGMGCVLPTGRGVRPEFIPELVRYIFRVCTHGTVFGLDSPSSVSCMCMCVCMAVGMCSPSVVPLVVSTCMRALYSIWHGRPRRRA